MGSFQQKTQRTAFQSEISTPFQDKNAARDFQTVRKEMGIFTRFGFGTQRFGETLFGGGITASSQTQTNWTQKKTAKSFQEKNS